MLAKLSSKMSVKNSTGRPAIYYFIITLRKTPGLSQLILGFGIGNTTSRHTGINAKR